MVMIPPAGIRPLFDWPFGILKVTYLFPIINSADGFQAGHDRMHHRESITLLFEDSTINSVQRASEVMMLRSVIISSLPGLR